MYSSRAESLALSVRGSVEIQLDKWSIRVLAVRVDLYRAFVPGCRTPGGSFSRHWWSSTSEGCLKRNATGILRLALALNVICIVKFLMSDLSWQFP